MKKTKNIMLAAAAATLMSSAVANAGFTYTATVSPNYYSTYDLVTFTLTGWTGTDNTAALFAAPGDPNYTGAGTPEVTNGIIEVSGTWSGATMYVPGTSSKWAQATTNNTPTVLSSGSTGFSASQGSFLDFDSETSLAKTTVTANTTASVVGGTWYTATKSQQPRPVDITPSSALGFADDGIDNTVLAAILVPHGTASGLVYNGQFYTDANIAGFTQQLTVGSPAAITLTNAVTATGTLTKYVPAVVPNSGTASAPVYNFSLPGESSTGHTLIAIDIVGGTLASFGSYPGTDVTATYASLFNTPGFVAGGVAPAYDAVLDLGAITSGTLSFTLPAGVTIGGVAIVPEPSSVAGFALLGLPVLARRRRA